MIGRQVYATGSYLNLADGKATGGVNLTQDADRVYVSIADAAGAVVRRMRARRREGRHVGLRVGRQDRRRHARRRAAQYVFQVTAARGNDVDSGRAAHARQESTACRSARAA